MASEQMEIAGIQATPANGTSALMRIIEKAAFEPDFSPEKLKTLLEVKERWEAAEAKKAYDLAMTRFKANPPTIRKNKHVKFQTSKGVTEYDHATLDHVCDEVTSALSAFGFSHRYTVRQSTIEVDAPPRDGQTKPTMKLTQIITVTCVLTHEMGHSEETTLQGLSDESGGKNSIQAVGSTVTYLQRYTLLAATGLAAEGQDDDGQGAAKLSNLTERLEWIANCKDLPELERIYKDAAKSALAAGDAKAITALQAAKDKRKRELSR